MREGRMNNEMKFGKRPIGVYLSNIMDIFRENNKARVSYVEARRDRINDFFQKLEQGGFLISKEYYEEKEYEKIMYFFQANGKSGVAEYFSDGDNLRVRGVLPAELANKQALLKFLQKKGIKRRNKACFFYREVYKK